MKNKSLLTTFAVIALFAMTPAFTLSQMDRVTPNRMAPTSFSTFSLPQNIGMTVNSVDNENNVSIAPNGLSLYFASNRPGFGILDIWVAQRSTPTAAWETPQNLGATINTASNENLPSLSPDAKTLFFSCSCPDALGSADIYMSTRTDVTDDFGWTAPVNLGAVINSVEGEVGPRYFEDPTDGKGILYFTSNRKTGNEDIYQSRRNADGSFNAPTNAVELNSPWLERGISIRQDGLEIFFSSQREGGLGESDIWVATRASVAAPWNPPVNLADINSSVTDQSPSISSDGSILYLTSIRDGQLDIYTATRVSVNRASTADFDGDGRTDVSVFRPSDGNWYIMQSGTNTFRTAHFGSDGDKTVAGDYDGDGRTDIAVFRPSDRNWYIQQSSNGAVTSTNWGLSTDRPVPGDYDGDGRTDIAIYRDGTWYLRQSTGGISVQQFGLASDLPISAGVQ